jgi:hypothetical protein
MQSSGAVQHHRQADRFPDDNDDALWAATDRIMADAAEPHAAHAETYSPCPPTEGADT